MEWKRTKGYPILGSSTDVLKSKEDPFGGTNLAGAMPLWVRFGKGVLLGWVSPGREKKESRSLLTRS